MSRALIESSAFFKQMEEFGFFDTVEEHLPDEFTMIYEIARILDSTEHGIAQALAPVMVLSGSNDRDHSLDLHPIPQVADAEEYEADLIRSVTELQRIYPYQHLLPEPVFLQRVAERSLWMPRPRVPKNYRYQSDSDRFAPDDRKQKVYVLFDTSSSMRQHYRIHLARAITYLFLQRNQRELGTIFFRTFDLTVGELRSARDVPGYDQLISDVMHVRALGNGTALQRALEQAIDDISHESMLSDTQILVITDGVAHVDVDALRARMGSSITVNTVKIGHSRMHVDAKIIEDQVYHSSSEDAMRLRALLDQRHQLESSLRVASGNMRSESIKSQLGLVERQISSLMDRLSAHVETSYGLEIQQLSSVYVEIDDISAREMFSLPEEQVAELEQLAEALLHELRTEHLIEDIKRAAILYDHLYLLMEYNTVDAPRLEHVARELESMLDQILNRPANDAASLSISEMERMQVRHMLEGGVSSGGMSLARLLHMSWIRFQRWLATKRQDRLFFKMLHRRINKRPVGR